MKCRLYMSAALLLAVSPLSMADTNEEVVAKRALERWNAQIEGRLPDAYTYFSPSTRLYKTLNAYKRETLGVGLWTSAEIGSVVCSSEKLCEVSVNVTMQIKRGAFADAGPTIGYLTEKWVRDGQWWLVPKID